VPDLKLALVGSMALDDPEGWEVYRQTKEAAREDPDIDIFTILTGVSNVEVNAFQRFSDVCVQKSIREGFGLVVSETLWKGTPMVAGEAGGIPMQMSGDTGGFLVASVEECAERLLYMLRNPKEGAEIALSGKEIVRERFLLTRLIADELELYASLLGGADGGALRRLTDLSTDI
jgi:trehalose synthase